jgi:hypothetical protein
MNPVRLETDAAEQEGPTLLLKGRAFRCIPKCPVGVVFDLAQPNTTKVHRALASETPDGIARRYRITEDELRRWNPSLGERPEAGAMLLVEQPSMDWAIRYQRVLNTLVVDEDQAELQALLYDREDAPDFMDLVEAVSRVVSGYAGRPTQRPSASLPGAESTGETSRADSSSPATERVVNLSRRDGTPRAS